VADVPNVQYINFVDTELTLQFDAGGSAAAMLTSANDPTVDLTGFRKVNILGSYGHNFTCSMFMGQVGLGTLVASYDVPLDGKIHTFEVHGPQMMLRFENGPANTTKHIQLLVYLRS
jgi:hypothetical protein